MIHDHLNSISVPVGHQRLSWVSSSNVESNNHILALVVLKNARNWLKCEPGTFKHTAHQIHKYVRLRANIAGVALSSLDTFRDPTVAATISVFPWRKALFWYMPNDMQCCIFTDRLNLHTRTRNQSEYNVPNKNLFSTIPTQVQIS